MVGFLDEFHRPEHDMLEGGSVQCGIIRRILKGTHFDAVLEYIFMSSNYVGFFCKAEHHPPQKTRRLKIKSYLEMSLWLKRPWNPQDSDICLKIVVDAALWFQQ